MTAERALRASIDACVRDYPGATRVQVEHLVRTFYERTSGAKVHQYRVVLAERDARAQLRADERTRIEASAQRVPPTEHIQNNVADLAEHRIIADDVNEASQAASEGFHQGLADCTR